MRVGANWSLLVVVWLIAWSLADVQLPLSAPDYGRAAYWVVGAVGAVTFFACLLAHELAHSMVARRHGVEVEGIVLWLFGGVSQLKDDPPDADAELRIAVAGPATSIAIALGFLGLTLAVNATGGPALVAAGLGWLGWINGVLAVFNLVPAFPLDGGRVLRAWLWRRHGDKVRATATAATAGRVFGYVLIGLGLAEFALGGSLGGIWLVFLGWFLLAASAAEATRSVFDTQLAGVPASAAMTADPIVAPAAITVQQLVDDWLYRHRCSTFPLVEADGAVSGLVTIARVKQVPADRRTTTPVRAIAAGAAEIVRCEIDEPLITVVGRMNESPDQRALVYDGGRLAGIVSPSDVARILERTELIHERQP